MKLTSLNRQHKAYPALLKEINAPPARLYIYGRLTVQPCVAIVGSRKITPYGREVTYRLARDLAASGLTIVSGLALGVDTVAHQAALETGGRTIAVMAGGLDTIYPSSNRRLAWQIVNNGGAIVSEYPLGTPPLKHHFPARNRIIAGLSLAVIVTEAPQHSGALITASFGLEQNRLIMAVPGNITSQSSAGCNNLLKAGALPVTGHDDVLRALDFEVADLKAKIIQPASQEEASILELLAQQVNDSEELIQRSGLKTVRFNQVISLMEISGKVRNIGGGKWMAN